MNWLDPAAIVVAFGVIFLAELPDKTMIATIVLATRYRRGPVWLGVGAALGLQTAIAVTAGGLLSLCWLSRWLEMCVPAGGSRVTGGAGVPAS